MNYDDDYWYEEQQVEPEGEIELNPEEKIEVKLSINEGRIQTAIQNYLMENFEPRIKRMVQDRINKQMNKILRKDYWCEGNMDEIIAKIVTRKLEEVYPDVVDNKVNELAEKIKNEKHSSREYNSNSLHKKAVEMVERYIENELKDSVKRSKDYIEQFSKNYFANNLFKAMGMMDKMLPQTESISDN